MQKMSQKHFMKPIALKVAQTEICRTFAFCK